MQYRKERKPVHDNWVVTTTDDYNNIMPALLVNVSESGGLFWVDGIVKVREHIMGCPWEDEDTLPKLEDIRRHPMLKRGVVVREDVDGYYGIRFDTNVYKSAIEQKKDVFQIFVRDDGIAVHIICKGEPSIKQVVELHDRIKQESNNAFVLIIDISDLLKPPSTGTAILVDLFETLIQSSRYLFIIKGKYWNPVQMSAFQKYSNFFLCDSFDDMKTQLNNHPIKAVLMEEGRYSSRIIKRALILAKLHVFTATNVEEAIATIENEKPNIVLISMDMLDETGIGEIISLQESNVLKVTPIVLLIEEADKESVLVSKELGINEYITKPFDTEKVIQKIVQTLTKPSKEKKPG